MAKLKIAVTGAAGRMGRELVRAVHGNEACVLAGAVEQAWLARAGAGRRLSSLGLASSALSSSMIPWSFSAKSDAGVDFSAPVASLEPAALAANARIDPQSWARRGMSAADEAKVAAAARHATIIRRQHEPRHQPHARPGAQGCRGARRRLRYRGARDASRHSRRAVGHGP